MGTLSKLIKRRATRFARLQKVVKECLFGLPHDVRIKVLFPLSEANEVNVFFCLLSLYVNTLVLRDILVQLPQCEV